MFSHVIGSDAQLRALMGEPLPRSWAKEVPALDDHCRALIARSPFLLLATAGPFVTPRGGPAGFVRVLDDHRLAFADFTGNRRGDSHRALIADPRCELLFLVPGIAETLRVRGTAVLTTDPELLATLPTGGRRAPAMAVGVTVERAFIQCGKALRRSELWDPATWPDLDGVPSAAEILRDHVADGRTVEEVQAFLDDSYSNRIW